MTATSVTGTNPAPEPASPRPGRSGAPSELLIITGMSGAGRSTAAKVLEDLGWYVVDNLPPQLIQSLLELTTAGREVPRLAVAVDVRGRSFFAALEHALADLEARGAGHRVLFLDATDEALVRRFESVRRPHPLQGEGRLLDGILRERKVLDELRSLADTIIDTSYLNVHELAHHVSEIFGTEAGPVLRVSVVSFGFKYGLPLDADHVADVRFLPNPFWVPDLRPHTGLDPDVRSYVLGQPGARPFLDAYVRALEPVLEGYVKEKKRYATVAVGCTGGKHRSVAMSEALAGMLRDRGTAASAVHRDLGRE
ncbi:MAG TPA: RNase adapter RapZ [Kineosporiaceae bacterium]|nr:RNase adapter RapZ [Kineosporiaceae bacterium]